MNGRVHLWGALTTVVWAAGCGDAVDQTALVLPDLAFQSSGDRPFQGREMSSGLESAPRLLSDTGAFADAAALEPAAGLVPYDVASPLWTDGALKQRWLSLPAGETIGFEEYGAYDFPVGTVLVKHFGMVLDERAPDVVTRLETRFLVAGDDGDFHGLVYRWNSEQTDAALLEEGLDEDLEVIESDGSTRVQTYSYPGPGDCSSCHSARAGFVIGPRTNQLNRDHEYAVAGETQVKNQLAVWNGLGYFDPPLDDRSPADYPSLAALDDEERSVEDRVRSYWDSNCSSCHTEGAGFAAWDARYEVPLREQNVIDVAPFGGDRGDGIRLIAPGDPQRSLMYRRAASTEPGTRMPPVARNRVDEAYVALLRRWIFLLGAR